MHEYECEERNRLDKEDGNAGRAKSMIETPRGSWASRSVQLGTRHLFEENLYLKRQPHKMVKHPQRFVGNSRRIV